MKQNFEDTLPDTILMEATAIICESMEVKPVIDIGRFSSSTRLLLVTARVLQVVKTRSLKGLCIEPSAESLQIADDYWVRQVQKSLYPEWEKEIH